MVKPVHVGRWYPKAHRLPTFFAAVALSLTMAACGDAEASSKTVSVAESAGQTVQAEQKELPTMAIEGDEWETDIRLGVDTCYQLYTAEGADVATWLADVQKAQEEGLKDAISLDDIKAADADALIDEQDGQVFHIGPSSLFGKVEGPLDAYRLAYRLMGAVGGSDKTNLQLLARVTKNDISVYNFQQVKDGEEVRGSTLKIALDKDNEVTAVFCNIDHEAADDKGIISQKDAEAEAAKHAEGGKVLPEYTQLIFISTPSFEKALNLEDDSEPESLKMAWVVYTTNEGGEDAQARPFVAHHVQADGTYLNGLTVAKPGDIESVSGYRAPDVFEGLKGATYTTEVERADGKTITITVPVMHSEADNCYYLGDVEHHIVVADFYEAAYGDHDVHLVMSKDNKDWDIEDVYLYYNYLRARDFYANMGWVGPDGQDTDEIILKGLCYSNRKPYINAASLGPLQTWQGFGYASYSEEGEPLKFGWGLDVMGHEFTHTFTTTVMGQNLYQNDYGAINEAMSDIMGNLIEFVYKDTDDAAWTLGENTGSPLRCMSDPRSMNQPAYVWDEYYGPQVSESSAVNDNGGVHSNSSLLNLIAADLCLKHGMDYQEAVDLWVTVSLGLTAKTDYRQEPELITWALEQTGLADKYQKAVDELVEQTRIDTHEKPEPLPADQQLVTLQLPDTETFETNDWCLVAYQVNVSQLKTLVEDTISLFTEALENPDALDKLGKSAEDFLNNLSFDTSEIESPELVVDEDAVVEDDPLSKILGQLLTWASDHVTVKELRSWEENDTHVIPLVEDANMPTVYMLLQATHGGSQIDHMVIKLGDSWYDMGSLASLTQDDADGGAISQEQKDAMLESMIEELMYDLVTVFDSEGKLTTTDEGTSKIEQLPTAGLENILPVVEEATE